jgi:RNA polymerase sigma factor (sigma-70 family)
VDHMTGSAPTAGGAADTPGTAQDVTRDAWLAVRCQLGERAAFDLLIERWHGPLWTYARRVTGSDDAAHEVVQDAWLRILRGLPRLRDATRLRPWLFGIARRTLMDRLRGQYAAPSPSDVDLDTLAAADAGRVSASAVDAETDEAGLLEGLAGLPVIEREVLTLFYLRELSLAEVAELLDIPIGTVKSRLHRARRVLRQALTSADRRHS